MASDVDARIKQILTRRLGVPPEEISGDASLVDDFGLDSVDMVELTIAIEQEFKIWLGEDELRDVRVIGDVIDVVERLTNMGGLATGPPSPPSPPPRVAPGETRGAPRNARTGS